MNQETAEKHYKGIETVLYMAFELSNKTWTMGFSIGLGQKVRLRTVEAGNLEAAREEIEKAKKRFGLPQETRVMSCYEAGRDGFWLHRYLETEGIENHILDSASIETNRRKRRAKGDKLDANSLVRILIRYDYGEKKVFSTLHVPTEEEEDRRQLHRELTSLNKERTRTINRIRGLLATQGIRVKRSDKNLSVERVEELRMWNGQPLGVGLKERIRRECEHLEFIKKQIGELTKKRQQALKQDEATEAHPDIDKVKRLQELRGIGIVGAWVLVRELFGWRYFKNRRQVGSLAGLVPMHYQSGDTNVDQGISKAGVVEVRRIAIELAWSWLRYQPGSKITLWYNERFAKSGKKARKIGAVAVARKLLVELWRYLNTGALPEGAELKAI
jgi:transposase